MDCMELHAWINRSPTSCSKKEVVKFSKQGKRAHISSSVQLKSCNCLEYIAESCHWFAGWRRLRDPLLTPPLTFSVNSTFNYRSTPNDTPLYSLRGRLSMAPDAFFKEDVLSWVSVRRDLGHITEPSLYGIINPLHHCQAAEDINVFTHFRRVSMRTGLSARFH